MNFRDLLKSLQGSLTTKFNNYENRANVFFSDILEAPKTFDNVKVDVVCPNSPYYLPTQKNFLAKLKLILQSLK